MTNELPHDATGDALRRLRNDGANLAKAHEIDFQVAVPNRSAGEAVMAEAEKRGFKVRLSKDEDGPDWTVCCTSTMVPGHGAITAVEEELDSLAKNFGGNADGWGAFPVR